MYYVDVLRQWITSVDYVSGLRQWIMCIYKKYNSIFIPNMDFVDLILLALAGIILYFLLKYPVYITYFIKSNNSDFIRETRKILKESSINNRYKIKEVFDETADIVIELRTRESLMDVSDKIEYYPGTKKQIFFSYTWQFPKPYIAIDETNWFMGVPESGLSLENYRKYVIQHEFLHALGFDHQPCDETTAVNGICPILYQSTRGCPPGFKCGYDVTDADYTKRIKKTYF
jgi:hypothetical protein